MGRIGRSFQLVSASYRVLMQDKELMVLPLVSGIVTLAVVASAAFGFNLTGRSLERGGPEVYIPAFLLYVTTYAIGIFFQAAVVAGASERMRGGDPTVGSALAAAWRRIGAIVLWAIVAATVGIVLRVIQDRVSFVGKIIVGLVGAAWSLATLFVVPVLVFEDESVPDTVKRSVAIFRKTWGESVVGGTTLAAATVCAWVTLVAVTGLLSMVVGVGAVVVLVAGGIGLMIFFSALQGVYVASLYRYATDGRAPDGFDGSLLTGAFVPKGR